MNEKHSPLPWKVQPYVEGEDGVGIISLRNGGGNPSNGVVAVVAMFPTEMDANDPTRAQANAELIVKSVNATLAQREPDWWRWRFKRSDGTWSKWIAFQHEVEVEAFKELMSSYLERGSHELQGLYADVHAEQLTKKD